MPKSYGNLEDDRENAQCRKHYAEHDGRNEEEFLEAALRAEILHAVGAAESTPDTCGRGLEEDDGDEDGADQDLCGRQDARQK